MSEQLITVEGYEPEGDSPFERGVKIAPREGTTTTDPIDRRYDIPEIIRSARGRFGTPLYDNGIYVSLFEGRLRPDLALEEITELIQGDYNSVDELSRMPGYIGYSPGETDSEGWTQSLCAWQSAEAAIEATQNSEAHLRAVMMARQFYIPESIKIQRFNAKIDSVDSSKAILTPL